VGRIDLVQRRGERLDARQPLDIQAVERSGSLVGGVAPPDASSRV
jgi:hypothetical protein